MHLKTPHEVLCTITTASGVDDRPMDWRKAIADIPDLHLVRFSMFLTGLDQASRQECYDLLRKQKRANPFVIPFVHARSDMQPGEYHLLMHEFGTELFNLHVARRAPQPVCQLPADLRERIYIENLDTLLTSDLEGFAGICLDLSHLEMLRVDLPDRFPAMCELLAKYPIGCNHVSAYQSEPNSAGRKDKHRYSSLDEFSYLNRYPASYYGKFMAIELTNDLPEQLPVKHLLEKMLRHC